MNLYVDRTYKKKKNTNILVYRVAAQLKSLLAALAITCLAEGLSWPMTGFLYLDKYNFYKVLKTWDNFSRDNHSTIKVNIILICSTMKLISLQSSETESDVQNRGRVGMVYQIFFCLYYAHLLHISVISILI